MLQHIAIDEHLFPAFFKVACHLLCLTVLAWHSLVQIIYLAFQSSLQISYRPVVLLPLLLSCRCLAHEVSRSPIKE